MRPDTETTHSNQQQDVPPAQDTTTLPGRREHEGQAEGESTFIAKTFQGLEPVLAEELTRLGANDIQIGRRMVSFTGSKEMLYRANFCLRTAIRVLKPIKQFRACSADDVYDAVSAIDWSQWLTPQTTFAVDSVVYSNEFRHSKFVAYKVKDAIVDQLRKRTGERPNVSVTNPDLQLHIHISDYDATLALDSSGESLHRRGYRQESVAAPLNEVLAAGILLMTGWHGERDLLDPFCGSGTFCIEAALIARGIAPGIYRKSYAFQRWPDYDADLFAAIYNDDSSEQPFNHHIYGRDIEAKAVGIARRNVKAAGLARDITIMQADFRETSLMPLLPVPATAADDAEDTVSSEQPSEPQPLPLLITNPPYGERLMSPHLLELYHTIGTRLKREWAGGEAWVLSMHEDCFREIGLKPSLRTPLYNGALEVELRKYQLFAGRLSEHRAAGHDIKTDAERREMARPHRFKQRHNEEPTDDTQQGDHYFNRYSNKEAYQARRPYGKPFGKDSEGGRRSFGKPFTKDSEGGRRPYGKPFAKDSEGGRRPYGKPFAKDSEGGRRSFGKPFAKDSEGGRRPFGKPGFGNGKPGFGNSRPHRPFDKGRGRGGRKQG